MRVPVVCRCFDSPSGGLSTSSRPAELRRMRRDEVVVKRDESEINGSLSRTNVERALAMMPAESPFGMRPNGRDELGVTGQREGGRPCTTVIG